MLPEIWRKLPSHPVIRSLRAGVGGRMRRFCIVLMCALPAAASDFTARYPSGSIRDEATAQAALKDVDEEMARIARTFMEREAECYRRFLVNSCRDDVRRDKELAERAAKRVQLEANDLRRKLAAEDEAKRRAEHAAARAAEDAERARNSAASRAELEAREARIRQRSEAAQADASTARDDSPSRPASAKDRLTAAERAENVRKYQEKQAEAAKRAQEAETRRIENERRRAEKRRQSEQREAQREAIRRKAEQALK